MTMRCLRPFQGYGSAYGCGRCLPCRITSARTWTARQVLEAHEVGFENSAFLTLTYNEENLPKHGSLVKEHFTGFRHKVRDRFKGTGRKMRFFGCGEYGDKSERPHYHLSAFGISPLDASFVQECWPYGFTQTAEFNAHTARYVTGYVTKFKTRSGDMGPNRIPEFARMSPGLGKAALERLIDKMHTDHGADHILSTGDVFLSMQIGNKEYPLGRYLINKLRDATFGNHPQREKIKDRYAKEQKEWVLSLYKASDPAPYSSKDGFSSATLIARANVQHGRNVHARDAINRSRRSL
jgi:hypothetical protein